MSLSELLAAALGRLTIVWLVIGGPYLSAQPTITSQPKPVEQVVGGPAVFTVIADGTPPLNYQWYRESTAIPGATNDTLILTHAQLANAGFYSVAVSNAWGHVVSMLAPLSVRPPKAGDLDFSFAVGSGINGWVINSVVLQNDGKVLIGGDFTALNGAARGRVARLNRDGTTDYTFGNGLSGANGSVFVLVVQPNGKVLVGGRFTAVNGISRTNVARLNADGSLDQGFLEGEKGADGDVDSLALQPDGKVLIGGFFRSVNGIGRGCLARLNADGSLDTGFLNGQSGASDAVDSILVQADGKVLIAGYFGWINGTPTQVGFARLNADGSLDTGFSHGLSGVNGNVNTLAVQADGKVLIGGQFSSVNGTNRNYFARLNADGSLDPGFPNGPSGVDGRVSAVVMQADGKLLIGGEFHSVDGVNRQHIARLNADGSLDMDFLDQQSGADGQVKAIAPQADGQVLIGGSFKLVNGIHRVCVARLNPNGGLDSGFSNGELGLDNAIASLALLPDGKVLLGGSFTRISGIERHNVARLNADGSVDTTFLNGWSGPNAPVNALVVQVDGKVLMGGGFTSVNGYKRNHIARLNVDGSLDSDFLNNLSGANSYVSSIALQADGKVLIGGWFTSVNGVSRNNLARLNYDGSLDLNFLNGMAGVGSKVNCVVVQADGKVLIGGDFTSVNGISRNSIARLNADGSVNTTFLEGGGGVNFWLYSIAVQTDSRILIGGEFSTVNGIKRKCIARLHTDGSLDRDFLDDRNGAGGSVFSIALQADGKALIGGMFTSVNGVNRGGIARLNLDGSLDMDFLTGLSGADIPQSSGQHVRSIVVQADGNILIGGDFRNVNGVGAVSIARLCSGAAGQPATNNVPSIASQPRSQTVMTGTNVIFTVLAAGAKPLNYQWQYNGVDLVGATNAFLYLTNVQTSNTGQYGVVVANQKGRVASDIATLTVLPPSWPAIFSQPRSIEQAVGGPAIFTVMANGSAPLSYQWRKETAPIIGATNDVLLLTGIQSADAGLYSVDVANSVGSVTSATARLTVRRPKAGDLDYSFALGSYLNGYSVDALALQADGKILMGGDFSTVPGAARGRIARLNQDGTIDDTFGNGFSGANGRVSVITPQPDGKVLIGGSFTSVNGSNQTYLARLNTDGSLDTDFHSDIQGYEGGVKAVAVQADGKVLVGGIIWWHLTETILRD